LQPHEFVSMLEGYIWRQESKENMFAYFTAQLMNLEGKSLINPIGPLELLKPLREKPEDKIEQKKTDEEHLKEVFHLKEKN